MTSPLPTDEDREALLKVLAEQGLSEPAYSPHSWRCEHPDRYPDYCTCARDMADAILAAGFRRSVVSTPSDEVLAILKRALETEVRPDHLYEAVHKLVAGITDAVVALEASAVSAPPTITDEALLAAFEKHYLVDDADPFYDRSKLLVGLRAVAALGGEA